VAGDPSAAGAGGAPGGGPPGGGGDRCRGVTAAELAARDAWVARHLLADGAPPFAFRCGGRPSGDVLAAWRVTRETVDLPDGPGEAPRGGRTRHTAAYADPRSGLVARCEAVAYGAFPTVEWTLTLRNEGPDDSPLIEEVLGLDLALAPPAAAAAAADPGAVGVPAPGVLLHHATGSPARADDYRPLETVLRGAAEVRLAARGGRPSDTDLPYTNLEWPGGGVLVVVGWPGQWAATFARQADGGVRVRAGQEGTRLVLRPGEGIRAPLMVLQFYRTAPATGSGAAAGGGAPRDWITAQNVWRRWMLAFNVPRPGPGGPAPPPFLTASSSSQFHEMEGATEENQRRFVDAYLDNGVGLDYWWMDAGWYVSASGRWPETGTWEVDRRRFPDGLRAVADHAHARGVKTLVWFEPERVTAGSWLERTHPEWLLPAPGARSLLLDLGHPAARAWAIEHFGRLIAEQGVDLYRQDFNLPPLAHWRAADAAATATDGIERQGLAENRHVTGYLAFWDALRRRHPHLLIDACASGGRRNDLETLRRAIPLHVTDHDYTDVDARPALAYGLAHWIPVFGTMVCRRDAVDAYAVRSAVGSRLGLGFDVRHPDLDWAALRRLVEEWRATAPCLNGDFYPLTAHSTDGRDWIAFQHDRPEEGDGVVHVFRRRASPFVAARFPLRGLDPDARYRVSGTAPPGGEAAPSLPGRDLLEAGLPVTLTERPAALILRYRRV